MSPRRNWPWSVLEMDAADVNPRAVKRAYAKKLKLADPEVDPKGFQELRTAYESALAMSKGGQGQVFVPFPPDPIVQPAKPKEPAPLEEAAPPPPRPRAVERPIETAPQTDFNADQKLYQSLVSEMQKLVSLADFTDTPWRAVLNKLVDLDFAQERQFQKELLLSLNTSLVFGALKPSQSVPRDWLGLLDDRFGWFTHGLDFQRQHPEHFQLWHKLNDRRRPEGFYQQAQDVQVLDPQLPFFLRWWALLAAYVALIVVFG